MPAYDLTYSSVRESENEFFLDLDRIFVENKVDGPDKKHFMVILSEAFTNALIHGNKLDSQKSIKIRLVINQLQLSADIFDEGTGGLANINNRGEADLLAEGGRGIQLMEYFSTETKFQQLAQGLKVTVILNREPASRKEIV